jgi:hypothetical protein
MTKTHLKQVSVILADLQNHKAIVDDLISQLQDVDDPTDEQSDELSILKDIQGNLEDAISNLEKLD